MNLISFFFLKIFVWIFFFSFQPPFPFLSLRTSSVSQQRLLNWTSSKIYNLINSYNYHAFYKSLSDGLRKQLKLALIILFVLNQINWLL